MKKSAKQTPGITSIKPIAILLLSSWLTACGGGGGGDGGLDGGGGDASGTITLSGDDTSAVGTELVVGHGYSTVLGVNQETIMLIDEGSSFIVEDGFTVPVPGDPDNAFIVNVFNGVDNLGGVGISMRIDVNGATYEYGCVDSTAPHLASSFQCGTGAVNLNFTTRTLVLDNAQVEDDGTGSVLSLSGTVTW